MPNALCLGLLLTASFNTKVDGDATIDGGDLVYISIELYHNGAAIRTRGYIAEDTDPKLLAVLIKDALLALERRVPDPGVVLEARALVETWLGQHNIDTVAAQWDGTSKAI